MKMDESEILRALQITNKLLILNMTKDMNMTDSIVLLSRSGLQPKEIAECLGTTSNVVSVTLSQIKSGKLKIKKKPKIK